MFTRLTGARAPRSGALRRRTAIAIAVASAAVLALAGCSTGTSSGTGTTTISFTSWDTQATMKPVIAAFEKANPTIKIDFSFITPANYISTMQTRLLAGTAADVIILGPDNLADVVTNKQVVDLSNESWVSKLSSVNTSTYSVDDKLYGLSVTSWGGGIMYNKDLLEKVGVTKAPTSWADFLALCTKLKNAGITPFLEPGDGIDVSLLALLGLRNAAADGKMDANIFSGKSSFEKEWTPVLETWGELFTSGVETRSAAGLTGDQVAAQFTKGSVAMIGTGSWAISGVKQAAPDMKVGFFAVPGTTSGDTYWAGAASPAYAINSKTTHLAQAKKFLDFLASPAGVKAYNASTGAITTTSDFTPSVESALEPMVTPVKEGKIYFAASSWPKYSGTLSPYVNSLLQQFIQGSLSAKDLAQQIDDKLASLKKG